MESIRTESQSSVELSTNSKGATQIVVKCYNQDLSMAEKLSQETYDRLKSKYTTKEG